MALLEKIFRIDARSFAKIKKVAVKALTYEKEMAELTDKELQEKTPYFKALLKEGKTLDDIHPEAFAVCREAAKRVLKQFPYPVQIIGATVLHEGDVAEMRTGEGKTLTATMAVYLNALSGKGVHVVTVNEYLAQRDAEWMGQIYTFLGLTVGVNLRDKDTSAKQEAYNCDITYTTNSELGFDYLRDNMSTSPRSRVLRGLNFAVVDEADSILIDESRTPLIISGGSGYSANTYITADRCVKSLRAERDFTVDIKKKSVTLTEDGVHKVEAAFGINNLYEAEYADLVHRVYQALKANYSMRKDVEYMVADDQIHIIDMFTGRVLQGREYSDGLHQAIQAKEHVTIKPETVTMATITYQNFFRLYDKLSGMTGTAKTEEEEFRKIYNMRVICVPTNMPIIRVDEVDLVFANKEAKYKSLLTEIKRRHELGQPLLIGTSSVEVSEFVDQLLTKENLPHEILNAKNHAREALIVLEAGKVGQITVATNMAGRGTDIKITDEVKKLGGLCVLGTERAESRRIDNQLRGRSGRQGDPGCSRFFVSLDDELMLRFGSDRLRTMFNRLEDEPIENKMVTSAITSAQKKIEGQNFDTRKNILEYDDVLRQQREIVYKQRDELLYSESIFNSISNYFDTCGKKLVGETIEEVDQEIICNGAKLHEIVCPKYLEPEFFNVSDYDGHGKEDAEEQMSLDLYKAYLKKRKGWTKELADYVEKFVVLQMLDRNWTRHIDEMSKLREGIYLRSYSQSNPLQAYMNEGYDKFNKMTETIADEVVVYLLHAAVQARAKEETPEETQALEEVPATSETVQGETNDGVIASETTLPSTEEVSSPAEEQVAPTKTKPAAKKKTTAKKEVVEESK